MKNCEQEDQPVTCKQLGEFEMDEATTTKVNADLIRSAYDAFSRGDIAGAFAVFAKDIRWHIPGRGPLSRDYRGHAEVQGFFQHFMELSSGTFRLSGRPHLGGRRRGRRAMHR